jgi:hypothetical protein
MAISVDERQESGGAEWLVLEVEGAHEAQRARQKRPHPDGATVYISHCTGKRMD